MLNTPVTRQIDDAVREFERACEGATTVEALNYFDLHALEIWFGCAPDRLRVLLQRLVDRGTPANSVVNGVYAFLLGDPLPPQLQGNRLGDIVLPEAESFARMYEARLAGDIAEAVRVGREVAERRVNLHSVLDRRGGWNLFLSLQLGTTAMLAGELSQALSYFAEARMHPPAPTLRFLRREACAKEALLEACEGDIESARQRLVEARAIERAPSWSEPSTDAILTTVAALCEPDHATAEQLINGVQAEHIGEMWPYYAIARSRVFARRGAYTESERQIIILEGMALPRVAADGYPGNIPTLLRAALRLGFDDPRAAEELLATADPELPRTQLLLAVLSLNLGQPRQALQRVLDMPDRDRDLRQIAMWRHAILASAHQRLDQLDECRSVLKRAMGLPGTFTVSDAQQFEDAVRAFAAQTVPGWPLGDAPQGPFARAAAATGRHLTEREVEVLVLLASGRSRDEIAAEQFISLNTLKTQLRSVYRKLGVSQRSAAVLEAQRRGLL